MNEWIEELSDVLAAREAAVLVTVAGVRGSAPREVGAKMIVTSTQTIGTIGGGQLEYQCTRVAVDLLTASDIQLRSFPLGAAMGQCCGGVVEILFEPVGDGIPAWLRDLNALHGQREPLVLATGITAASRAKFVVTQGEVFAAGKSPPDTNVLATARDYLAPGRAPGRDDQRLYEPIVAPDLNIAVFGAGHVGAAVVNALSTLDCSIRWIDSRPKMFRHVPANVRAVDASQPSLEVAAMPPGSYYLVMTHSHSLDFDICDRILRRRDARYAGLIGSVSKRRRFEKRYRQQGLSQPLIDRLVCPIGVEGISGKKPAEIAVAVAADILKVRERSMAAAAAGYQDNVRPIRS